MREITKRLQQMSNKLGYEGREEERKAIIKEHLTKCLEVLDLTLQDIAKEPYLIYEHYIFDQWMFYSFDIYLFFDIDILLLANDFLQEYGYPEELKDYVLVQHYAECIVFENINQWAEEEAERAAIKPL